MALTNDQVTAKNFKAIVDGMAPFLGAKTQTISESAFEQLSQAEKDNGTAYFVPDATAVTNLTVMGNRFDKANIYNGNERLIGSWFGKPLYQRTYTGTSPSSTGSVNVIDLPSGLSNTRIIDGYLDDGNSFLPLNWGTYITTWVRQADHAIAMNVTNDFKSKSFNVTIQYTKTADATVNIGTGNDYSTDEQIVGTWIDGKPLYQKTITGKCPNSTTPKQYAHNIANVDMIKVADAFMIWGDGVTTPIPVFSGNTSVPMYSMCITIPNVDRTVFTLRADENRSAYDFYITFQYTKTTD